MFYQILRSFLGPFAAILDFFASRTEWLTLIFGIYLAVYGFGRLQLKTVVRRTDALLERLGREWVPAHPGGSSAQFYQFFYPRWDEELKHIRVFFIQSQKDLLPAPMNVKNVLTKIPLSPEYAWNRLSQAGILTGKEPTSQPTATQQHDRKLKKG